MKLKQFRQMFILIGLTFSVLHSSSALLADENGLVDNSVVSAQRAEQLQAKGDYDLLVLSEDMGQEINVQAQSFLQAAYGADLVQWKAIEQNGQRYNVYAYPYDPTPHNESMAVALETRLGLEDMMYASGSNRCVRFFQHAYYQGASMALCGLDGNNYYHTFSGMYINNRASSFNRTHDTSFAYVYDGTNYTGGLGWLSHNHLKFSSSYNDKISSVHSYH